MHMIHRDEPLVLSLRSLFGSPILCCLVVAVLIGAVHDSRIQDPHVNGGVFGIGSEDADSVARKVADLHVAKTDILARALQMNTSKVDAIWPSLVASNERAAK